MIPARYANALFSLLVSGMMSCIVTCVSTIKAIGIGPDTVTTWMGAWAFSWPIAFSVILIVGPLLRRLVNRMVSQPD